MTSQPPSQADMEAAIASLRAFNVEAFTLLALALAITGLRTFARIRSIGWKNLWVDDYLVVLAMIFYSVETALAYSVGNVAHGLANNSMTDEQREALGPDDSEYQTRVLGSKIQLAGWSSYSVLLWLLKGAMCTFYFRLMKDLEGYRGRIYFGFCFIVASWLVVMLNLFLSCRPFSHMWQINPNPGLQCQPAISPSLIWTYLSFNVATDLYLIAIPMPMLFKAEMPWFKRTWLVALFSCGLFVTMAAILRVVLLVSDPVNGAQLAGSWAVRETFVAVVTTNLPMLFPHFKKWFSPLVSAIRSKIPFSGPSDGTVSAPVSLDPWRSKSRRVSHGTEQHTRLGSEEHIIDAELSELSHETSTGKSTISQQTSSEIEAPGIQRQVEVSILAEEGVPQDRRASVRSGNYTSTWSTNVISTVIPERSQYFGDHIDSRAYKSP
ncbi:hypothetical protein S7711_03344 [Stachybotrys chartarum IBT 7711]|uniref:Rhodopsin domain-containing protein n=1 Tax=Stachybotrys chartarum (strain CBS 109288 / IBT 7711) TaxID=1280523 RepID=A0A084AUR7_STACB|nr:hypothetical protein S7711_03344 [Stachybotrys chartarum IBT 7711]KFA52784.1 hypothetical protein S40293_00887 [Stachybotrys chartarum IBT 40293]